MAEPASIAAARGDDDRLRLTALAPRTTLNLRCDAARDDVVAALGDALARPLPLQPNRVAGDMRHGAIWLGPDEWLLLAADEDPHALETRLRDAIRDDPWLAVTDVSQQFTAFELAGAAARDVLAKGCPLDLHRRSFAAGDSAQTLLAHAHVLLCCLDETPRFELLVRNSYGHYLAAWLQDALLEYAS